ncbi:cobalamin-5-phosphate synthase CobS [Catenulispora acidiphila DSM 44928]|uniref:Adenosylcobinamide-GDP ribazoletransferase n=1 Tax=Catenulispora acidiphila (strain DSM 44928 / JCM 14897 / NBRC 102108 / NRRL B-24433 / ID139908) TaxID=479433 RepID=C7QD50_CATAD|nr:adenosylcobinamide-GDP ribazoletransferase [Catenulispora acidiphila]ACU70760.1 cobalamin-5-phosphate synthase CobS [Catenulispora acidiphila DSM 44928]
MSILPGLRLAFSTLTALPIGPPQQVDRTVAGRAMACAPVVGGVLGATAGAVGAALGWWTTSPVAAAVGGIATLAALTRGLHLDGLADTADGLGSAKPAPDALRIMKASDIGPFGVITLVLALLGQVLLLTSAWGRHGAWYGACAIAVSCVAGRLAVPWACRPGVPSARPDGLGAWVAGSVSQVAVAIASTGALVAATIAGLCVTDGARWLLWPAAIVAAIGSATLVLRHTNRRFGGITGDVLGALVETGFTVSLLVLAR